MSEWCVRRLHPGDEEALRSLRLEALADAPDAFGSSLEREQGRNIADWRNWLEQSATFVIDHGDTSGGLVAGRHHVQEPAVVQLVSMWVRKELRGTGAAGALVEAVTSWARESGQAIVRLDVVESNIRARRLYEKCGFHATGKTMRRERDGAIELEMERR